MWGIAVGGWTGGVEMNAWPLDSLFSGYSELAWMGLPSCSLEKRTRERTKGPSTFQTTIPPGKSQSDMPYP